MKVEAIFLIAVMVLVIVSMTFFIIGWIKY